MFLTQITKLLDENLVSYALVGGYAVALHGAIRGTVDIDLVLSLDQFSFEKAEEVFLKMGLVSKLPVTAAEVFKFRKEYIENRNLAAWSFYDPKNPAHLLDIIITEDLKDLDVVKMKIHGETIKVASIPSLIRMKTASGRPQDLEDIRALKLIGDR